MSYNAQVLLKTENITTLSVFVSLFSISNQNYRASLIRQGMSQKSLVTKIKKKERERSYFLKCAKEGLLKRA